MDLVDKYLDMGEAMSDKAYKKMKGKRITQGQDAKLKAQMKSARASNKKDADKK